MVKDKTTSRWQRCLIMFVRILDSEIYIHLGFNFACDSLNLRNKRTKARTWPEHSRDGRSERTSLDLD